METRVLVVCGLNREAAIAAGDGATAIAGGGSRSALEQQLASVKPQELSAVVSFGLAGGLDETLRIGDLVCPDLVVAPDGTRVVVSPSLLKRWCSALSGKHPGPGPTILLGVDTPILTPAEKRRLREASGADAIDMESHVAAAFAARHGLPFGVLRIVSDTANHSLPPLAGTAMRPDGSVDVLNVLKGLARDPGQIPALLATAIDAGRAFRQLGRVRGLLGAGFGLHL